MMTSVNPTGELALHWNGPRYQRPPSAIMAPATHLASCTIIGVEDAASDGRSQAAAHLVKGMLPFFFTSVRLCERLYHWIMSVV